MVESMLPAIVSYALVASAIGLLAWIGSRLYRQPALWQAIWVLAIFKLYLPPIWSIHTTLLSDRVAVVDSNVNSRIAPSETSFQNSVVPNAIPVVTDTTSSVPVANEVGWGRPSISWNVAVLSLWGLGSLVVLTVSTVRIARFHALVRCSDPADMATAALVEATAASLFQSVAPPRVRMVDCIVPPLLWPVGRKPTIVLPATWWQVTTDAERRTVLMHELVHWRRGDHWVRLLQWIASIVYWWHPLVWIACGELHRLEEQCCDAEVMHRLPDAGRSYASALLSASQWLGNTSPSNRLRYEPLPLAMPMSDSTHFASFHRRIQMLPRLKHQPWTRKGLVTLLLVTAIPLSLGLSAHGQQVAIREATSASDIAQAATLAGRVTDLDGKPLANAKVLVVIPAVNIRKLRMTSKYREVWGQTDASGNYSIDVPGIENETGASIDIMHRGHRRLVGTLMSGGDPNEVKFSPGGRVEFNAKLSDTLYFAGQAVDEAGKPIEGVIVASHLNTSRSSFLVELSTTDAEGRFAVYSYDADYFQHTPEWGECTADISFTHDQYIFVRTEKLEVLEPTKRDTISVLMQKGFSIAGTVVNPDHCPARDIAISIDQRPYQRKAARTDAQGKFRFDGVHGSSTRLRVVDVPGNSKSIQTLEVDTSNAEMTVALEPFESPITTTHQVLGMILVDVTESINTAYDLQQERMHGAMIVDPGKRFNDFGIGELKPGDVFWMVGMERVDDLRAIVNQLIKEAKSPTIPQEPGVNPSAYPGENDDMHVRVVYSQNIDGRNATNTQYMKLTPQDIAELEKVLETL